MPQFYIGLMSGTSLDGVDAVLANLDGDRPEILTAAHIDFDAGLREALGSLLLPGADEIDRVGALANRLAQLYAAAALRVLADARLPASSVRAIGCHGQTVRHRPERGYTVQIGNAALLAEIAGVTVVADFRSRDVAAGGQGAPLVPAFHARVFAAADEHRAILNLGGIANVTILPLAGETQGFDTGPGNCLMDAWADRHLGQPCDRDGAWARSGTVDRSLLEHLLAESYFALPPPKSTGRELFAMPWLDRHLRPSMDPADIQATLLDLTAVSATRAVVHHAPATRGVIACGGGTGNSRLMERISQELAPRRLETSDQYGVPSQLVEATAFAWLAQQALEGRPANLPGVTGASGPRILGAIYPGGT